MIPTMLPESISHEIKWHEVTWYSKLGAIILFVGVIPPFAFYVGTQYQAIQRLEIQPPPTNIHTSSNISESITYELGYGQGGKRVSITLPAEWYAIWLSPFPYDTKDEITECSLPHPCGFQFRNLQNPDLSLSGQNPSLGRGAEGSCSSTGITTINGYAFSVYSLFHPSNLKIVNGEIDCSIVGEKYYLTTDYDGMPFSFRGKITPALEKSFYALLATLQNKNDN